MATNQDSNATPGTLKAALALWMALMAGLLGYSISTADSVADETHPAETSESPSAGIDGPTTPPTVPTPTGTLVG